VQELFLVIALSIYNMGVHNPRIQQLMQRYVQGRLNRQEFDELFDWLHQTDGDQLSEFEAIWHAAHDEKSLIANGTELFERIKRDPRYGNPRRMRPFSKIMRYAAVASVILLGCSIATWFYFNRTERTKSQQAAATQPTPTLEPGGTRATLEWTDGGELELDDVPTGIAMRRGSVAYGDGAVLGNDVNRQIQQSETLMLRVPRGGQYRITLEDGTIAWLNAGSSLQYPVRFANENRRVVLTGEGYFEVTKDPDRPFLVQCGNTVVTVLGTRFNVSAYPDDNQMVTTLVEGSVRVRRGTEQVALRPDQAAIVDGNAETPIRVKRVNAEAATAWTTGLFMFDRDAIPDVMKRISRWYDADIVLQGNLEGRTLGGTVSRYESAEQLLKVLALTGNFNYKIEGRRIIVME